MLYSDWTTICATLLEYPLASAGSATPTGVAAFDQNWPRAVEYAETRMQRDLDLLSTVKTDATGVMTINQRKIVYPTDLGRWVAVTEIIPLVSSVKQRPLEFVSREFMDFTFPSETNAGASVLPKYWCVNDEVSALVGPAPATALSYEMVGTIRFSALSNTNVSNVLSLYFPDLYVQASMIFWAELQRDDPWRQGFEAEYAGLLASAATEEARKKFANISPSASRPTALAGQAA